MTKKINEDFIKQLNPHARVLFKEYKIAAECGMKTVYDLEYNYSIEKGELKPEGDCEMIDGVCVFHGLVIIFYFQVHTAN